MTMLSAQLFVFTFYFNDSLIAHKGVKFMKKIILVLMISLSVASVFASDHKLKTSTPWKVAANDQTFVVPQIKSGFFVVTIYNQGPNDIDVGPDDTQAYTGCSEVSSGSSCSVTFYPTATPAKSIISIYHFQSNRYARGTVEMTYYP